MKKLVVQIKTKTFYDFMKIIFTCIFVAQLLVVFYMNLTQLQYHLGYDATAYYLKAIEAWKQKTLFCNNWSEQTTLFLDSAMPLAALFYGICKNIFIAYGLANNIVISGIILVLYRILKKMDIDNLVCLICMNMVICPYLTASFSNFNDLSYFSSALTSNGGYGVKPLIVLMLLKAVVDFETERINKLFLLVTSVLCFVAGISSGMFILIIGVVPCMVFLIYKVIVENNFRYLKSKQFIYMLINAFFVVAGKTVASKMLGFQAKDSTMVWVGLIDFWKNLGSIILGYLQLLGTLPVYSNVLILTKYGVIYVFAWFILLVVLIAFIWCIVKAVKKINISDSKRNYNIEVFGIQILFNCVIFSLAYTTYGAQFFENRYLIASFYALVVLIGYFLQHLDRDLILTGCIFLGLSVSIGCVDIYSNVNFQYHKIDYNALDSMADELSASDSPIVYVWGDDSQDVTLFARNLRVMDTTKIYKLLTSNGDFSHFGDYTYYDDNEDYTGETLLVTKKDFYDAHIPVYIKNKYTYFKTVSGYDIYTSKTNPIDNTTGITSDKTSIDYPYSRRISILNGSIDEEGLFNTDGTEGIVMRGTSEQTLPGKYNFTINYKYSESESDDFGYFDIAVNSGDKILGQVKFDRNSESVTIANVAVNKEDCGLEYRVFVGQGTKMQIRSIEIEKID